MGQARSKGPCHQPRHYHDALAKDELNGERSNFYRTMLANIPAKRISVADEIADLAELVLSDRGSFITGSDFLMDCGATAAFYMDKWNRYCPQTLLIYGKMEKKEEQA